MSEESKPPPPSFTTAPPSTPPVTTVDMEKTVEKEAPTKDPEAPKPEEPKGDVEADSAKRFLGALIDGIIIAGVASILGSFIGSGTLTNIVIAALWLTRDSLPFLKGQSIGKMAMRTKAVKEDGSSLAGDWQTGALRNALFVLPILGALVEGIVFLTRKETPKAGIRLGDEWAKTKVVSVD